METSLPYHLPKVHEEERTYPAPSRQSLHQPVIGGNSPISGVAQPQFVYVQAHGNPQYLSQYSQQQQQPEQYEPQQT